MTGFYIDERIGLTVTPGCAWNEKASTRWKCSDFEAPPRKSRLLARVKAWPSYLFGVADGEADPRDNDKPIDAEWDWGKA